MKKHHPMWCVVSGSWPLLALLLLALCWPAAAQEQGAAAQGQGSKAEKQTAKAEKQTAKAEKQTAKAEKQTAKAEKHTAKAEKQAAKAEKRAGKPKKQTAKAEKQAGKPKKQTAKKGRQARKGKKKTDQPEQQSDFERTVAMLDSHSRDQVESAIQNLGLLGEARAVEPLVQRIRRGLPPDLLEVATMTLMALGQPSSGPVLFELIRHRRPKVRTRAAEAITAVNPPNADKALLQGLQDGNRDVRAAAATGLGEIGARDALSALFRALDRGVLEASASIGKLVPAEQVGKLLGYLNTIPLYSLGPALREVLNREDVTENAKLEVVARLQEVATSEVKGLLVDFLASSGESAPPNLVRAVERAIQQIAD